MAEENQMQSPMGNTMKKLPPRIQRLLKMLSRNRSRQVREKPQMTKDSGIPMMERPDLTRDARIEQKMQNQIAEIMEQANDAKNTGNVNKLQQAMNNITSLQQGIKDLDTSFDSVLGKFAGIGLSDMQGSNMSNTEMNTPEDKTDSEITYTNPNLAKPRLEENTPRSIM